MNYMKPMNAFYEAGDIVADGVISLIDILALATQIAEGTW
ncbi:hypothetical protein Ct9H90mP29_07010 [bacterium]|nr:MAG: hypothetical protein Ct9H90mP29_07010 [bacterium]